MNEGLLDYIFVLDLASVPISPAYDRSSTDRRDAMMLVSSLTRGVHFAFVECARAVTLQDSLASPPPSLSLAISLPATWSGELTRQVRRVIDNNDYSGAGNARARHSSQPGAHATSVCLLYGASKWVIFSL